MSFRRQLKTELFFCIIIHTSTLVTVFTVRVGERNFIVLSTYLLTYLLTGCCRAMLCISAVYVYAVVRCLSVRPSVLLSFTFVYCVKMNNHIHPQTFSSSSSHAILVFPYQTIQQYSYWNLLNRDVERRGYEKSQFSTNFSLYLGNDTR